MASVNLNFCSDALTPAISASKSLTTMGYATDHYWWLFHKSLNSFRRVECTGPKALQQLSISMGSYKFLPTRPNGTSLKTPGSHVKLVTIRVCKMSCFRPHFWVHLPMSTAAKEFLIGQTSSTKIALSRKWLWLCRMPVIWFLRRGSGAIMLKN